MKAAFTTAHLLPPGNYGRKQQEILVLPEDAYSCAADVAQLVTSPGTRFLAISDSDHRMAEAASNELNVFNGLRPYNSQGFARPFELDFKNEDDFRRTFTQRLYSRLGITHKEILESNYLFPNLVADVDRTIETLRPLYNFEAPFSLNAIFNKGNNIAAHVDFFGNPKRRRAVRSLDENGTLIQTHDAVNIYGSGAYSLGYEFLDTPWHAGPGLCIIGGATAHSAHPSKTQRKVYSIDAELRAEFS